MLKIILVVFIFMFYQNIGFSKDGYFLTLRYDKVNLRQGPSSE